MATPGKTAFMHSENEAFIFMDSSRLQSEIILFLGALGGEDVEPVEPDHELAYEQLSAEILKELPHMLPLSLASFPQFFGFLSEADRRVVVFRVYQLLRLVRTESTKAHDSCFAVSPAWNRRWSDLVAGLVINARTSFLSAGDYQP